MNNIQKKWNENISVFGNKIVTQTFVYTIILWYTLFLQICVKTHTTVFLPKYILFYMYMYI